MVFEPTVLSAQSVDFITSKSYVKIRSATLWECGPIEWPTPPDPFQLHVCPFLLVSWKITEAGQTLFWTRNRKGILQVVPEIESTWSYLKLCAGIFLSGPSFRSYTGMSDFIPFLWFLDSSGSGCTRSTSELPMSRHPAIPKRTHQFWTTKPVRGRSDLKSGS